MPEWLVPDGEPRKKNRILFLAMPFKGHIIHLQRLAEWFGEHPEYTVHFGCFTADAPITANNTNDTNNTNTIDNTPSITSNTDTDTNNTNNDKNMNDNTNINKHTNNNDNIHRGRAEAARFGDRALRGEGSGQKTTHQKSQK